MDEIPRLPLSRDELPPSLVRFGDPAAPDKARTMAARGLVPLKGGDLVALLLQLSADKLAEVAEQAKGTLEKLPENVLAAAVGEDLHPSFLDALVPYISGRGALLEAYVQNHHVADVSVARIARTAGEAICEAIAVNQERLLRAPQIIESLYKNRNARMSTVDRLVELAARNGVDLDGVHTYAAHVEAIQGQLIPEASDEPLPGDQLFVGALEFDSEEDAIETDAVEGKEELKERFVPLSLQIQGMSTQEKLRLTIVGSAAARALLVRDANKIVSQATITSPMVTEAEATGYAQSRQMGEDILRFIGNRREWLGSYELKKALVFNPKTPVGISMKFLSHMHVADLRNLARSRGVPAAVKTAAAQRVAKKGA